MCEVLPRKKYGAYVETVLTYTRTVSAFVNDIETKQLTCAAIFSCNIVFPRSKVKIDTLLKIFKGTPDNFP